MLLYICCLWCGRCLGPCSTEDTHTWRSHKAPQDWIFSWGTAAGWGALRDAHEPRPDCLNLWLADRKSPLCWGEWMLVWRVDKHHWHHPRNCPVTIPVHPLNLFLLPSGGGGSIGRCGNNKLKSNKMKLRTAMDNPSPPLYAELRTLELTGYRFHQPRAESVRVA